MLRARKSNRPQGAYTGAFNLGEEPGRRGTDRANRGHGRDGAGDTDRDGSRAASLVTLEHQGMFLGDMNMGLYADETNKGAFEAYGMSNVSDDGSKKKKRKTACSCQ